MTTIQYFNHAIVTKVIRALKTHNMYDNTIILVTTDNGGGPWYSNTPLKGTKETLYEGGIRAASFLLSPLLQKTGYRYTGLLHLADWAPTFLQLVGVNTTDFPGGGMDVWEHLNKNTTPSRIVIHNIDEEKSKMAWQATATKDQYKLLWGQDMLLKKIKASQANKVELYNIVSDPEETTDIAHSHPDIVKNMKNEIMKAKNEAYERADYPELSRKGWPINFDGIISSGWCESQ